MEQISIPDLPFSILALASFTPEANHSAATEIVKVDPLDIDHALTLLAPSVFVSLTSRECAAGSLKLQFKKMRDFTPDGLLESQPYLQKILAAHRFCEEGKLRNKSPQEIEDGLSQWPDLPSISLPLEKSPAEEKESSLDNILSMVDLPDTKSINLTDDKTEFESYGEMACEILHSIYADPAFRNLESCWQGLRFLGRYLAKADGRLAILPVLPENIEATLDTIKDQVISTPPSLMMLDQVFSSSEISVQVLNKLANFGQEMFVPQLTGTDFSFFQVDTWQKLDQLSFLPHHIEGASFAKYKRFQESAEGRWLSLASNRFLTRFPYGPKNRSRLLPFKENGNLWLSPIWAVGALMASRVLQTGAPAGMASRNVVLEDLALSMEGSKEQLPMEVYLTENRLDQLLRCGIIPLTGWKNKDMAFLAGDVMASSDVSLSYQSLVCKVTHFILWCRDHWLESLGADELSDKLHAAFILFIEKKASTGELIVDCHDKKEGIHVSFRWHPSRESLPGGEEIVLEFIW